MVPPVPSSGMRGPIMALMNAGRMILLFVKIGAEESRCLSSKSPRGGFQKPIPCVAPLTTRPPSGLTLPPPHQLHQRPQVPHLNVRPHVPEWRRPRPRPVHPHRRQPQRPRRLHVVITNSVPRATLPPCPPPSDSTPVRKFRSDGLYSPISSDVTTQSKSTPSMDDDASKRSLSTLEIIDSFACFFNELRAETVSLKGRQHFIESANLPNSFEFGRNPNRTPRPATIRDST